MNAATALRDAENVLRDFIGEVLQKALGAGWENQCGVSEDRIVKWRERRQVEEKRQETGVTEERLLYYADFYDLKTILKKHWGQHFSTALGDWKTMEVWLTELERLRDPDAHRRELLPHQHHLALGISGEIRTRIARFRSSQETGESYFPRIESVRDSLGTLWVRGDMSQCTTRKTVRPGDTIDIVVTASDPLEEQLQFVVYIAKSSEKCGWQESNAFSLTFRDAHVGLDTPVFIQVKSLRQFHAGGAGEDAYDDLIAFFYDVLPPRTAI